MDDFYKMLRNVNDLGGKEVNMKFEELRIEVLKWADSKDLLKKENADKQFLKFVEEVFEFKTEMDNVLNYGDVIDEEDHEEAIEIMMLEMGDIFVTLIILCKQLGISPERCLEMAYNKISKRTGKTINGIFIKEEDL